MTKAGSKGGNLRDKLDGNELDLSLSDLNEVPVKELVSTAPRGPALALGLDPAALCPASVSSVVREGGGGGSGPETPGAPRPAPAFSPGCTRVTLARFQKVGGAAASPATGVSGVRSQPPPRPPFHSAQFRA